MRAQATALPVGSYRPIWLTALRLKSEQINLNLIDGPNCNHVYIYIYKN